MLYLQTTTMAIRFASVEDEELENILNNRDSSNTKNGGILKTFNVFLSCPSELLQKQNCISVIMVIVNAYSLKTFVAMRITFFVLEESHRSN
jgi:hypothetical protein